MDKIKDLVNDVIGKMSSQKPGPQAKMQEDWRLIVGEAGNRHTRLGGIKDGLLMVYVDSPAWLFEMNLKRSSSLAQLQKNNPEVKKIIFKIGKV